MVIKNRRKNGKGLGFPENPEAKREAELLHEAVMERMLTLGNNVTMYLVPIGYDILENRRVRFERRSSPVTGVPELFLPKEKLERVIVFEFAVYKQRKYYHVFSNSTSGHKRVVWGGYCTEITANELIAPYSFNKQ